MVLPLVGAAGADTRIALETVPCMYICRMGFCRSVRALVGQPQRASHSLPTAWTPTVRVFPNIFSPFCNLSRATLQP